MAVITISRQYGSGGDEIARRVCDLLGYQYFDKAAMAQVAAEMGLSEEEFVDFSEDNYKVQSILDRLLNWRPDSPEVAQIETHRISDVTGVEITEIVKLDKAHSVNLTKSLIEAAYKRGNTVIVGRGGQAILRNLPGVLHTRIKAPLKARVLRLHQRDNYSLGGAHDAALKHDHVAADYLRLFYNVDWSDPVLYDLTISTEKLDTEVAAKLIVRAVKYLPPIEASGPVALLAA